MATSNNDRISSQRLLDTLKGLQESRHLGSEPEVVTETVEYPVTASPAVGTYENEEAVVGSITPPDKDRLPIKLYINSQYNTGSFPVTIPEPNGDYVELTKSFAGTGVQGYFEDTFDTDNPNSYTGYGIVSNHLWVGEHWTDGNNDLNNIGYVWEMPAKTVTTTTKTKHTIKQDYVPNADWNVNDPDADGYVKGRTHWVEFSETEATVNVQSDAQMGNFAIGACDKFGSVKGFTYPTGEYNPGRVGEIIDVDIDGNAMQFSCVGEDANGNAIAPTNLEELMSALSNTNIGIILIKEDDASTVYIAYPNVATNDNCTVNIVGEVVYKLDRKFYDYQDLSKYAEKLGEEHTQKIKPVWADESLTESASHARLVDFTNAQVQYVTYDSLDILRSLIIGGVQARRNLAEGLSYNADIKITINNVEKTLKCTKKGSYDPEWSDEDGHLIRITADSAGSNYLAIYKENMTYADLYTIVFVFDYKGLSLSNTPNSTFEPVKAKLSSVSPEDNNVSFYFDFDDYKYWIDLSNINGNTFSYDQTLGGWKINGLTNTNYSLDKTRTGVGYMHLFDADFESKLIYYNNGTVTEIFEAKLIIPYNENGSTTLNKFPFTAMHILLKPVLNVLPTTDTIPKSFAKTIKLSGCYTPSDKTW